MFKTEKQKIVFRVVYCVYFIFLIWVILFKTGFSILELQTDRTLSFKLYEFSDVTSVNVQVKWIILNILVFIPLGAYFEIIKPKSSIIFKSLLCFVVSLLFESVQYILAIGAADITDLINNTIGGLLGIIFALILKKICKENTIEIINKLGCVLSIIIIGILGLCIISN